MENPLDTTMQFLRTRPELHEWLVFRNETAIKISMNMYSYPKNAGPDAVTFAWKFPYRIIFYARWMSRPLLERVCILVHELCHCRQKKRGIGIGLGHPESEIAALKVERGVATTLGLGEVYLDEIDRMIMVKRRMWAL